MIHKPAPSPASKLKPNATEPRGNKPATNPQAPQTAPPAAPATQKGCRNSPRAPSPLPAKTNKNTGKAGQKIHKNSLDYVGDTHLYVIRDAETGIIQKYGESAAGKNKLGQSKRAQFQVRKLKRETGKEYESKIVKEYPDKKTARFKETKYIKTHRKVFGKDSLQLNKTNH